MRLTVIIPHWRGRSGYLERLLDHAKNMPYILEPVWNEGGSDYFAAVAKAVAEVATPYCMRADDDDFLGFTGIERALDFLDANPDHVAAAGLTAGFTVCGVQKPHGALNRRYLYYTAHDLSQPSAASRIEMGGLELWVYYAVHRTQALQTVTRDIARINFSDLLLYEAFHVMRTLNLGKVHLDRRSISYFRQTGTSTSGPDNRNWASSFLSSNFTTDLTAMVEYLGHEDVVYAALENKMRQFLRANYSDVQRLKWKLERQFPAFASWYQNRYRPLAFCEWWKLRKAMVKSGASEQDTETADWELAGIRETLNVHNHSYVHVESRTPSAESL